MRNWFVTYGREFLIIILAFVVILYILNQVMGKFTTVGDMVAVLGVVLPIISTIAAAAIGVSVGTTTGAKAANERMAAVKKAVTPRLQDLHNHMEPMHSQIKAIPLVANEYTLNADNIDSHQIKIDAATLDAMKDDMAGIECALDTLP